MSANPSNSVLVLLSRTFWIMFGPLLLMVLLANIAFAGTSWITALDILFFATLAGILLARWLEFRSGAAESATGEPVTAGDLQRYALGALVLGIVAWVVANLLGNHWLGG